MADTRWRKVVRDATLHLPRTIVVSLAIAVTLAAAGTVLVSWALVRRATAEGFLASDPPAATLRLDSVTSAALDIARATPGVREVQARRTLALPIRVGATAYAGLLFATAQPAQRRLGTLSGMAGDWPPPDGSIAIERSSSEFSAVGVGDTVAIMAQDSLVRRVPVRGLVRDVGLAPGWMEHVVYAWASTRTLELLGLPSTPSELELAVVEGQPDRAAVLRVARDVRERLSAAGVAVRSMDVPVPGEHIHAAQMDSMLFTQGAFGVLALCVGAFLVTNLLAGILARELRQVGIMKTLGGDTPHLMGIYLSFAAGLGAVATVLALPVALVAGRRYAELRASMLNFDLSGIAVPWWALLLLVLVGVALPVAAAWVPVRRGACVPVAAALRDVGMSPDVPVASFASLGGWSRVLALSLRNAFRRRGRLVLTVLTLGSGGSVFIAAGNLRRAVVGSMDLIFGGQRYAFSARLVEPQSADAVVAAVRAVEGVTGAELWSTARATLFTADDTEESLSIVGVPANTKRLALNRVGAGCLPFGDAAGRSPGCGDPLPLTVSRSFRRLRPDLQVGDPLPLVVAGKPTTWRVTAMFDGAPLPQAYTTTATLAALRGDARGTTVVVATDLAGLAAQADLIARVRASLNAAGMSVASTQRVEESRRVTEDHLLMVVQFLGGMGWIMIVVGGMGLASTMGLAVLERTREIGVMRAIGASHGSITALVQVEGLTIAALAWVVSIPASVPFSLALGEAFGRIMFRVPTIYFPAASHMLAWLGVTVAVSVLASAWPARRATSVPVAAAIAHEG